MLLHSLFAIRSHVALVTADRALNVCHFVALPFSFRTVEAEVANRTTNSASLLRLVESEAVHNCQLLHAVSSGILELGALWVQQRLDQLLSCLDLLLGIALDMHVHWHLHLLICLILVTDVPPSNENPTTSRLLEPLVVDTSSTDDHSSERGLRILLKRNDDLLDQSLRLPFRRRNIPLDVLDHVPDEPVVFRKHRLPNSGLACVQAVAHFIINGWR
mmetsp:Transcript_43553/g.76273  ORF Transcript_43553/g.76273 Transcript_43553/m.76273 type:complete len:217 (-) Transcript_43553:444-1094(-)